MKQLPIWDILTGLALLGVVGLACVFVTLLFSPNQVVAPMAKATITRAVIIIPTLTETSRVLPPTWTPTTPTESTNPEAIQPTRTLRPTSTIEPTSTLYIAPTATPLPTFTPLPSATRADANCYVIAETPLDNAEFQPNQEFTKNWTLKNNSGKAWQSSDSDFRFDTGTRMHTGPDVYDLARDVNHANTIDLSVRMRAPSTANTYTANWVLVSDSGTLCRFFVKIVVK
jgi:hypothetical protein